LSAVGPDLLWRARYRDDDSRVWRATAARAEELLTRFLPAKPSTGPIAALASLRPVRIDVRVEAPDGRAAGRAVTRLLVAEGVRLRRWRDGGLAAVLHLPAGAGPPCATLVVDALAGPREAVVAGLAGPLLASRGALVLTVAAGSLEDARDRLAAVPGAGEPLTLQAADPLAAAGGAAPAAGFDPGPDPGVGAEPAVGTEPPAGAEPAAGAVPLPPGVGLAGDPEGAAAARAAAWDALLARLGATPRPA
jgi:hypothetical protein